MAKLTRIHVNQHVIKHNVRNGLLNPVLTVKDYLANRKAYEAIIHDAQGQEVARVIFADGKRRKPLDCGARVWIETKNLVTVVDSLD